MDSADLQDESETAETVEVQIVAPSGAVLVTRFRFVFRQSQP